MKQNVAAVLLVGLCACGSASSGPGDPPAGGPSPTLTIDSPTRGTTVDGQSVTITGHATGGTGLHVTVNATDVAIASDGSFTTTLAVDDGIDVIETHALDSAGHDVRDVRAVLAGALAPSDGTQAAPIGTHASRAVLATIANTIATDAKAIDYAAIARSLNPVYDNGGCLGATVDITNVDLGDLAVALDPQPDALATALTISNVVVELHANFKVACIGGSGTITVRATTAHITGDLGVSVSGGALVTSLPSPQVTLDGFDLQVSGVPSQISGLVEGTVRSKIESALGSAIQSKVPAIANAKLAGLLANPLSTSLLGADTTLVITPTEATLSPTGLFIGVDATVSVAGGGGGMFLTESTSSSAALMASSPNLGVAVANDLVNQLFAGLWAAGVFDKSVPLAQLGPVAALLDPAGTKLVLTLSLPPTAATDPNGKLQLALGDVIISVQDDAGTELQKLALSLQTGIELAGTPSGTLTMALDTPTVFAQVLAQVDDGALPLTGTQIEGIATGAWGLIAGQASAALATLPLPSVAGIQLGNPTVTSLSNYVVADVPLQ